MKRYANLFAATLLVLFVNSATAATSILNSSLSFNTQNIAAFSHLITPGYSDFNDLFTFTTTSPSGGASVISSFNGLNFSTGFSAFNLFDVTHGNTLIATGSIFGPNFASQLSFSGLSASTTYGLSITGAVVNSIAGGYYSGSITVIPVPEPTEFVLLACGLGMVGLIATRRRSEESFKAA